MKSSMTAAFTLIEMMIAMALGMLILYTSFAGFRTAAQAITIVNRLSVDNSLLRAGYFQVQNDLDFWVSLDDPNNTSNQKLRFPTVGTGPAGNPSGLPFTPMSSIYPAATERFLPTAGTPYGVQANSRLSWGEIKPRPPSTYVTGLVADPWEADRGFDPTVSWSPSDPRTWCQVNMAEKAYGSGWGSPYPQEPGVLFGRYAIFSNLTSSPPPSLNSWSINNAVLMTTYSVSYQAPSQIIHTWYGNQIQLFLGALGFEAMTEYLPTNAIYDFYMSTSGSSTVGGMSDMCTIPQWGSNYGFRNSDGGQVTACGIYRETYSTSFGYFNPWAPADPGSDPGLFARHYMHFDSDYTAANVATSGPQYQFGSNGLKDLLAHTAYLQALLPQKPTSWPNVTTAVGRLVKNDHFVAVAKINTWNAVKGSVDQLSFLGLGTTLRGARMQRLPQANAQGYGWAKWDDNPTVISSGGNDPNLDSPTLTAPP